MPPGPSNIRDAWGRVGADLSRVAARFLAFLGALVVQLTKRPKLAEEEFLLITLCGSTWSAIVAAIFQAHLAQWLRTQLMLCARFRHMVVQ